MNKEIKRGDLYYARLDPVVGSEQGGTRPVLILQNNTGNKFSPTTIIAAAITSRTTKAPLPTHVTLNNIPGLACESLLLLEQLRTIDCTRLGSYVGTLDERIMAEVDQALAVSVGLTDEQR